MKKKVLKKLKAINDLAELTKMEGRLLLRFTGCSVKEWDAVLEQITEFQRENHVIQINDNLIVLLILD